MDYKIYLLLGLGLVTSIVLGLIFSDALLEDMGKGGIFNKK